MVIDSSFLTTFPKVLEIEPYCWKNQIAVTTGRIPSGYFPGSPGQVHAE
jgi:hypothetical protein